MWYDEDYRYLNTRNMWCGMLKTKNGEVVAYNAYDVLLPSYMMRHGAYSSHAVSLCR